MKSSVHTLDSARHWSDRADLGQKIAFLHVGIACAALKAKLTVSPPILELRCIPFGGFRSRKKEGEPFNEVQTKHTHPIPRECDVTSGSQT